MTGNTPPPPPPPQRTGRRLPTLAMIYGRNRTDSQRPLKESNDSSLGSMNSASMSESKKYWCANAREGPAVSSMGIPNSQSSAGRFGPLTGAQRFIFVNRKYNFTVK